MKTSFFMATVLLLGQWLTAQDSRPRITAKWAPTGLVLGNVSLQGEYNFTGRNSLTVKLGIPARARYTFDYENSDARFQIRAVAFLAGYRTYLSRKYMKGFYFEPFFKYVHHTGEGSGRGTVNGLPANMLFQNNYNGTGIGLQLGCQFLIRQRFVIDFFFLGPEVNTASNTFKAMETTTTLPWSSVEAAEAEQDIRTFLDQFPLIRNRTDVMVDQANRTVTADFRGVLPGLRAGIAIGIAL